MRRYLFVAMLALATAAVASAQPTVTFLLESPQAGQNLDPGATVTWTISVQVSTGDNLGLAAVACDLAQDNANPARFDIPPADPNSIDANMQNFSRPSGICNPGETYPVSGYTGLQRGGEGIKNLVQVGGAQNTFGVPGSSMGLSTTVIKNIGQSGPQIVASGSFPAPSAPGGPYVFRVQNALANVIAADPNAPAVHYSVVEADVVVTGAEFSFDVGPDICAGDSSCDGQVDFGDINPFVDAMLCVSQPDPVACWAAQYPCDYLNNDINGDQQVTFGDINPFVDLLIGSSLPIICP